MWDRYISHASKWHHFGKSRSTCQVLGFKVLFVAQHTKEWETNRQDENEDQATETLNYRKSERKEVQTHRVRDEWALLIKIKLPSPPKYCKLYTL